MTATLLTRSAGRSLNVAVTNVSALIVTTHEPVPLHAPDQPAKVELAARVAVSVTEVPSAYGSLQSEPQEIPVPSPFLTPSQLCDGEIRRVAGVPPRTRRPRRLPVTLVRPNGDRNTLRGIDSRVVAVVVAEAATRVVAVVGRRLDTLLQAPSVWPLTAGVTVRT